MPALKASGRLALVLHRRSDPTPVVEKLTSWARSHGKDVIADARDAARLPGDVKTVSTAELDEQADALLPEEMRDVLPGGDAVALALDT